MKDAPFACLRALVACAVALAVTAPRASALSSAFTYQGQLQQAGTVAAGPCDFQFGLFDGPLAGAQVGATQSRSTVSLTRGVFTVQLDFGTAAFNGNDRFLQIAVRCPAGSGQFTTLSPRQPLTPAPYAIFSPSVVRNTEGAIRAALGLDNAGAGSLSTFGPNGNLNVVLGSNRNDANLGAIDVYNADGNARVLFAVSPTGEGILGTRGANGNTNVSITTLAGYPNHGFVAVHDASGNSKAGIYVNASGQGVVFGDTKNFAVDHPSRAGAKIVYTSLEGPEAALYYRGRVRLANGRGMIELPEHFTVLANADTMTVQLTPGSLNSKGLAFSAMREGRIEIGELDHGTGSYDVHFVVHAVRKGYEDIQPVLSADEFQAEFDHVAPRAPAEPMQPVGASAIGTTGCALPGDSDSSRGGPLEGKDVRVLDGAMRPVPTP